MKKVFDQYEWLDAWNVTGRVDAQQSIFATYLEQQLGKDNEEIVKFIIDSSRYIHVIGFRGCTEEAIQEAVEEFCPGLFKQSDLSSEEDEEDDDKEDDERDEEEEWQLPLLLDSTKISSMHWKMESVD